MPTLTTVDAGGYLTDWTLDTKLQRRSHGICIVIPIERLTALFVGTVAQLRTEALFNDHTSELVVGLLVLIHQRKTNRVVKRAVALRTRERVSRVLVGKDVDMLADAGLTKDMAARLNGE